MSVLIRLKEEKREKSMNKGKFYGLRISRGVKDTSDLCVEVEKMCTCTKSDVKAVIDSLLSVIKKELLNSNIVKIDGLGSFKLGIKTIPADEATKFSAATNIVDYRVNFMPARHQVKTGVNAKKHATHKTIINMCEGVSGKVAKYYVGKKALVTPPNVGG